MLKKFLTVLFLGLIILCPLATLAVEDSVPVETGNASYTGDCPDGKLCLNVPIGGLSQLDAKDSSVLGKYLTVWYNLIIGAVGVLATVMVMYGGFKWLTSRGNSGEVGQAKEIITSAIIGMVLAFLSFTILYLVNPRLTRIEMPKLDKAQANLTGSANTTTNLPDRRNWVQRFFGTETADVTQFKQMQQDYQDYCQSKGYTCEPLRISNPQAENSSVPTFMNISYDIQADTNFIRFLQENGTEFSGLTTEMRQFFQNLSSESSNAGSATYYYNMARYTFTGDTFHVQTQTALDPDWVW